MKLPNAKPNHSCIMHPALACVVPECDHVPVRPFENRVLIIDDPASRGVAAAVSRLLNKQKEV